MIHSVVHHSPGRPSPLIDGGRKEKKVWLDFTHTFYLIICKEYVLQPVLSHTLFKKQLARGTWLRAHESFEPFKTPVLGEPHNVHIGTPKLRYITEVLHYIALRVDRICGPARTATAAPYLVRRMRDHLSALHKHGNVNAGRMNIPEIPRAGVGEKLLQDRTLLAV